MTTPPPPPLHPPPPLVCLSHALLLRSPRLRIVDKRRCTARRRPDPGTGERTCLLTARRLYYVRGGPDSRSHGGGKEGTKTIPLPEKLESHNGLLCVRLCSRTLAVVPLRTRSPPLLRPRVIRYHMMLISACSLGRIMTAFRLSLWLCVCLLSGKVWPR